MRGSLTNYDKLISRLDGFIRKYYINQIIRGLLYSTGLVVLCFLVFTLAESQFYFGSTVRKIFFLSFLGVSVVSLILWIFIPLLHFLNLGKLISHEQAATIIGLHFSDVQDKLLNILQLRKQLDSESTSLIFASIEQKTNSIQPVPFQKAIDLTKNRKYLSFAIPPLLLLLGLLLAAPSLIKEPVGRIIHSDKTYAKAAPFQFEVLNPNLDVPQYDDFIVEVTVSGAYIPEQAFVNVDGFNYRLKETQPGSYQYQFNNVQNNIPFYFQAEGVRSEQFRLTVLKKPNIIEFQTLLDFPEYIERKDESLMNIGDLVIPQGTKASWIVQSLNTEKVDFIFADLDLEAKRQGEQTFIASHRFLKTTGYTISLNNNELPGGESVSFDVTVIPDLYPAISVEKFEDSTNNQLLYFIGDASDDYGLTRITFNYKVTSASREQEWEVVEILQPVSARAQYQHIFDLSDFHLNPGDQITYYFEAFDNDGVNGIKSSKTPLMQFLKPSVEDYKKWEDANEESIKQTLMSAKKESEKIQKNFKSVREKLLQEKSLDWQTKKELEKLLERQKDIAEQLQKAKDQFQENLDNQKEFEQPDEDLLKKQEKLQELFEELLDAETLELMNKIQELLQELEKEDALQMMENMEDKEQSLNMELDRLLELFKQLELERDVKQQIDNLKKIAEEEFKLSEETENSDGENQESLETEQEEINESFEKISDELKSIEKRNQELEKPKDLEISEDPLNQIEENLDKSMEQLENQEFKPASQSQKNAAQKMQEMAQQMEQQMQQGEMQQMQEDMKSLRQLLENLVGLSFGQEELIEQIGSANSNTPRYVELMQSQHKLKDDFQLIEDSLQALSKRVYQIESFVLEKVREIRSQMDNSISLLEERKKGQASNHQHRTMKNVNDLALMFSETMEQMQQQMAGMMSGVQMCTNPGNSNPNQGEGQQPLDKISKDQNSLNNDMRNMKQGKDRGQQDISSKEFAEMAARQAALRKALREIEKAKQERGQGSKELEKIIQDMDKIETDLVNKQLTNEMLRRQQEILMRLLESERAEREREFESKRESITGDETERKLPPSLEEYIKRRESEIVPFKTISPDLKPYYKQLVEEYYRALKS